METLVVALHVVVAVVIVVLVLLQQGKGADAGAAFGAGASQTMFGSAGTGNFLTRATTIAAVVFFATSLSLAIFAKNYGTRAFDDGLPVVNPELLTVPVDSDVPQLSAPQDDAGDLPALPGQ